MNIAIFYHCLFYHGTPPELRQRALDIIQEQWSLVESSGLRAAANKILIGVNGGEESLDLAKMHFPAQAELVMHGLDSRAENLTIVEMEKWLKVAPPNYCVLYFHAKGCTHAPGEHYGDNVSAPWRRTMTEDVVGQWQKCVELLNQGYESVGSHFMRGLGSDGSQNIWAGNFFWGRASFLARVPSIFLRDRIKVSGIAAAESRYEAEVWIGNGELPRTFEFRPQGGGGVP